MTFLKVNIIAYLVFKLTYYDVEVLHVKHYAMMTAQEIGASVIIYRCLGLYIQDLVRIRFSSSSSISLKKSFIDINNI